MGLIKVNDVKRHFLVKGVDENLRGWGGFQYPERGIVEAPDWNGEKVCYGGIFGIDWESFGFDICNLKYLIIEYNIKDGFVRVDKEKLKIRKGIVVYCSPDISKIQEWLEANGDCYRGYGASILVGDNEAVEAGGASRIITGNNCSIEAVHSAYIDCGNECTIYCGSDSYVEAGDGCFVEPYGPCRIKVGKDSIVTAKVMAQISAGVGSVLKWSNYSHQSCISFEIKIDEENSGKTFSVDSDGVLHEGSLLWV